MLKQQFSFLQTLNTLSAFLELTNLLIANKNLEISGTRNHLILLLFGKKSRAEVGSNAQTNS